MIFASIRHNLANLFRLSGRDSRASFWPYAIAVFLLSMAASILLIIPIMTDQMARTMAYVRDHPEGLPQPAPGQPQALPPELIPDMSRMIVPMEAVTIVAILLLAAAVARRLHDRGKSGWWGALPLPFQAIALVLAPKAMKAMTTLGAQASPFTLLSALNSLCTWAAIIFLIVLLAGEGTRGANRFGDAPRPLA
jgi:uncharacterized membrane protein YhaH (DUF805 family)